MAAVALPLETYRSTDPIENLQLRVTLRKRGTQGERRLDDLADETSTAPSDGKKKKRGGDDHDDSGAAYRGRGRSVSCD
mgnify:CR=1 FL=1